MSTEEKSKAARCKTLVKLAEHERPDARISDHGQRGEDIRSMNRWRWPCRVSRQSGRTSRVVPTRERRFRDQTSLRSISPTPVNSCVPTSVIPLFPL